jgi:crotonobetainyl-CoA:carnitine CoA-transferase CaiB-like acyl-CoA transferase
MLEHPDIKTRIQRIDNYDIVHRIAAEEFIKHPRAHWLEAFANVDVPFAPVCDIPDVFDDPQVRHLETFVDLQHPEMGRVAATRRPVRFDGSRADQPTVAAGARRAHAGDLAGARPE